MNRPPTPMSFAHDIKPLFRASDRQSMMQRFDLWNYQEVRDRAQKIQQALENGSMPCDGAWPAAQVDLFRHWVISGMAP